MTDNNFPITSVSVSFSVNLNHLKQSIMTFDANTSQEEQSLTTSDTKVELLAFAMKTSWPLLIPQTT